MFPQAQPEPGAVGAGIFLPAKQNQRNPGKQRLQPREAQHSLRAPDQRYGKFWGFLGNSLGIWGVLGLFFKKFFAVLWCFFGVVLIFRGVYLGNSLVFRGGFREFGVVFGFGVS